ncbi:hypothetical protein GCM10017562_43600 [Streptomyces roseofulvus]|uniref:ABC transporter permease n=2 Tax=Streptomyces TaxID=1883 RepID=A0ABU4KDW2_9ACTN|nr:hypothetical protein [Streptomyces roseolus]MDX2295948.1 hypothetical protein [Streptomyces roseolus]
MTVGGDAVRRGQGWWLGLVGAATVVLVVVCVGEASTSSADRMLRTIASVAVVPGVLALSQLLLLRSKRIEPATIGVAGLGAVILGVNASDNGGMLFGMLLALLAAVPFAFLSGFLSLNAQTGHALFSAVALLIGAETLVGDIAPEGTVLVRSSWLTGLDYNGARIPGLFLIGVALFLAVAWYLPRQERRLAVPEPGWLRVTVLLFVPAFLLAAVAGFAFTARIGSTTQAGLSREFMIVCLLGLTAGGCSLRSGEGTVLDVAVGSLFAGALETLLNLKNVGFSTQSTILCVVAVLFIFADLARLRRTPASEPPQPPPPAYPPLPGQPGPVADNPYAR